MKNLQCKNKMLATSLQNFPIAAAEAIENISVRQIQAIAQKLALVLSVYESDIYQLVTKESKASLVREAAQF